MLDIRQNDEVAPVCPFCEKELRSLQFQELRGFFGKRYVYFCGDCHKVLGISHRKGFWMG